MNNVILFKDLKTNQFIKMVNNDLEIYKNNLKIIQQAQAEGKAEIIYNEINSILTQDELNILKDVKK